MVEPIGRWSQIAISAGQRPSAALAPFRLQKVTVSSCPGSYTAHQSAPVALQGR